MVISEPNQWDTCHLNIFKYFFKLIYLFWLEANYFTKLWWFLPYTDMNQPWVYMLLSAFFILPLVLNVSTNKLCSHYSVKILISKPLMDSMLSSSMVFIFQSLIIFSAFVTFDHYTSLFSLSASKILFSFFPPFSINTTFQSLFLVLPHFSNLQIMEWPRTESSARLCTYLLIQNSSPWHHFHFYDLRPSHHHLSPNLVLLPLFFLLHPQWPSISACAYFQALTLCT